MATDPTQPYRDAVTRFGPRFESLLWNSPDGQLARFDAIIEALDTKDAIIADIGCGLGDLAERLEERTGDARPALYLGVDALPELLEEASARANGPIERRYLHADFGQDGTLFEHLVTQEGTTALVFSGSLNTFEQTDAVVVLERAWAALKIAPADRPRQLAFNFLSDRHHRPRPKPTGPAKRFDTLALLDWALERTPSVRFRQDYLRGHDALIVMTAHA